MELALSATPEDAVDCQALANLKEIGGDDPDFLGEMIDLFLEQAPRHLAVIEGLLREQDLAGVARAAHHVKSSSFYLGARKLSGFCAQVETLAKAGNTSAVTNMITALVEEFGMVQQALRAQDL